MLCREIAVLLLGRAATLDHAEVGHRIGQGATDDVEAPVEFLLVQMGQEPGEIRSEFLEDVAVVVVQELAQAFVVLGIGARGRERTARRPGRRRSARARGERTHRAYLRAGSRACRASVSLRRSALSPSRRRRKPREQAS
jgi:hypothetical protein